VMLTDLWIETAECGMRMLDKAREIDGTLIAILYTARSDVVKRYEAFGKGAFDVIEKGHYQDPFAEINVKTLNALRFREQMQQAASLRPHFDPAVVAKLLSDRSSLAMSERLVTVCFWDIRGFTRLCEQLKKKPILISKFLGEYLALGVGVINKHGGVVDKFIGDGIMALFGALEDKRDKGLSDAVAAVKAALDLKVGFDALRAEWQKALRWEDNAELEIGLGCGIDTGEAFVGEIGAGVRHHYTALGSTVNTAARIQDLARDAPILISGKTNTRIEDQFNTVKQGDFEIKGITMEVKGKPQTIVLWRVEGEKRS